MQGKPFAIIETDGHSADAGTKTRVEAFLHCVREDLRSGASAAAPPAPLMQLEARRLADVAASGGRVLVPPMGPEAEGLAAALRGYGLPAEVLPQATPATITLGRRHTSGKECLPMTVTAGALLERIAREPDGRFTFFMPGSNGPCRFGMYRQLHQMIVERVGEADRVSVWSPPDHDYFEGVPPGLASLVLVGCTAFGVLENAVRDVRVLEATPGAADALRARYAPRLSAALEAAAAGDLSGRRVALEVTSGRLYGVTALLSEASRALAAVRGPGTRPTVLLLGEIYVRSDPASNGWAAEALERRGIRVHVEPVVDYLRYTEYVQLQRGLRRGIPGALRAGLQELLVQTLVRAVGEPLGWRRDPPVKALVDEAAPYLRDDLGHEAVASLGRAVHAWRHGEVDGVLCVGPLECMPNKLVEAQLVHAARQDGVLSLTLSLNGDPIDPEVLDGFAFEVKERFRGRRASA